MITEILGKTIKIKLNNLPDIAGRCLKNVCKYFSDTNVWRNSIIVMNPDYTAD